MKLLVNPQMEENTMTSKNEEAWELKAKMYAKGRVKGDEESIHDEIIYKSFSAGKNYYRVALKAEIEKDMDGFGTGTATYQTYKDVLQLLDTVKPKTE